MAPIIKRPLSLCSTPSVGSSQNLFDMKIRYDTLSQLNLIPNIINFNIGEYIYYGRVNMASMPIVLSNPNDLGVLKRSADSTAPLSALKFVSRLFDEMALQFDKALMSRKISPDQKYLSNLKIYRAYESSWLKYTEYKDIYFQELSKNFLQLPEEQKFKDIRQFLNHLTQYLKGPASAMPFTYPSFVKSRLNDIMSTGLAIEIADIDYSNDQEKVEHFLNSPNWEYYVNACNQYGFIVDKQYPFRLVSDINSTAVINVARGTVRAGGYALLNIVFVPAVQVYLRSLASDLIKLYNLSTHTHYVETTMCPNGIPQRQFKKTPRYDLESFLQVVSIGDILTFYMTTRINEQKPDMIDQERHNLIRDCLNYYNNNNNLAIPLIVFEAIVSSTVDKIGSFAYYEKQAKELLASQAEGEIMFSEVEIVGGGGGY